MRFRRQVRSVLVLAIAANVLPSGSASAGATAGEVKSAAQDLAARLSASPPAASWVADDSQESAFQADVNRMAYLSSHLAAQLESGKGREETAGLYRELRSVGIRILRRSRATGEQLPAADVAAYEQLIARLESWYGPVAPSNAR